MYAGYRIASSSCNTKRPKNINNTHTHKCKTSLKQSRCHVIFRLLKLHNALKYGCDVQSRTALECFTTEFQTRSRIHSHSVHLRIVSLIRSSWGSSRVCHSATWSTVFNIWSKRVAYQTVYLKSLCPRQHLLRSARRHNNGCSDWNHLN